MKFTKILLIILYIFIETVKAQNPFTYLSAVTQQVMANCKSKGDSGVRQFSECDQESNYTNGQICCLAYGTNADGTSFRGCISMNLTMFQNRTLTYNSDTISGTVVCDKNYNYDNYLKYSFFFLSYLYIVEILL